MNSHETGFNRSVCRGDYVILATGAIGTAQDDYAAGYTGAVAITIDGQSMIELATSLTLPDTVMQGEVEDSAEPFERAANQLETGSKEPGRRLQD